MYFLNSTSKQEYQSILFFLSDSVAARVGSLVNLERSHNLSTTDLTFHEALTKQPSSFSSLFLLPQTTKAKTRAHATPKTVASSFSD